MVQSPSGPRPVLITNVRELRYRNLGKSSAIFIDFPVFGFCVVSLAVLDGWLHQSGPAHF